VSLDSRATATEADAAASTSRATRKYKVIHHCTNPIGDIGDEQFSSVSADIAKVRGELSDLDIQTTLAADRSEQTLNSILATDRKTVNRMKSQLEAKIGTLDDTIKDHDTRLYDLDESCMVNAKTTNHLQSRLGSISRSQARSIEFSNSLHDAQGQVIDALSYLQSVVTPLYTSSAKTITSIDNWQQPLPTIQARLRPYKLPQKKPSRPSSPSTSR